MNGNGIFIHSQSTAPAGVTKTLREGCFVFVRIVNKIGADTYTAFFAGARFTVTSGRPFEAGDTFTAKIAIRDGIISLIPQTRDSVVSDSQPIVKLADTVPSIQPMPLTDSLLISYFTSLGIMPDTVTFKLFQQLEQMGVRFDAQLINKSRKLAEKFSGHELEAAEAALLLEEKGIPATTATVGRILDSMEGNSSGGNSKSKLERNEEKQTEVPVSLVKDFFKSALYSSVGNESTGLLTLFNQSAYKSADTGTVREHWMILPYELSVENTTINGSIRLSLDTSLKICKKIIIFAQYSGKKAVFSLYYKAQACRKVRFYIFPVSSDRKRDILVKRLQSLLHSMNCFERGTKVEWSVPELLAGFSIEDTPVSVVRGKI